MFMIHYMKIYNHFQDYGGIEPLTKDLQSKYRPSIT
jgi:hypothetical protein